jgi:thiol-disulfide isomerase/thioredoxin
MKSRQRLFTLLAVSSVALVSAVLYGIRGGDVHASGAPPAVLDKLKPVEGEPQRPDIGFSDAMGKALTLADYRGRYVLVNLWATWCGPCITELPDLARLGSELDKDRMAVVAVDVLERLDAAKLAEFLAMHGAGDLPVHIDRERMTQRGLRANELPLTILIDSEGREIARAAGAQAWAHPDAVAYLKAISAPPAAP